MADRKAELERKKAKLEELRKEKMRRQKEREQQEVRSKFINFHNYNYLYPLLTFQVENSHRVLRGEGDQNITMDKLLEQFGVKPVSGN